MASMHFFSRIENINERETREERAEFAKAFR